MTELSQHQRATAIDPLAFAARINLAAASTTTESTEAETGPTDYAKLGDALVALSDVNLCRLASIPGAAEFITGLAVVRAQLEITQGAGISQEQIQRADIPAEPPIVASDEPELPKSPHMPEALENLELSESERELLNALFYAPKRPSQLYEGMSFLLDHETKSAKQYHLKRTRESLKDTLHSVASDGIDTGYRLVGEGKTRNRTYTVIHKEDVTTGDMDPAPAKNEDQPEPAQAEVHDIEYTYVPILIDGSEHQTTAEASQVLKFIQESVYSAREHDVVLQLFPSLRGSLLENKSARGQMSSQQLQILEHTIEQIQSLFSGKPKFLISGKGKMRRYALRRNVDLEYWRDDIGSFSPSDI